MSLLCSVSNIADNVLPQTATININFRLLPGGHSAVHECALQDLFDHKMQKCCLLQQHPTAAQHLLRSSLRQSLPVAGGFPCTVFLQAAAAAAKHY
jgi:acetylornithine deacetylase/succinyl-diaminopimelate desuccinylase-like protein